VLSFTNIYGPGYSSRGHVVRRQRGAMGLMHSAQTVHLLTASWTFDELRLPANKNRGSTTIRTSPFVVQQRWVGRLVPGPGDSPRRAMCLRLDREIFDECKGLKRKQRASSSFIRSIVLECLIGCEEFNLRLQIVVTPSSKP